MIQGNTWHDYSNELKHLSFYYLTTSKQMSSISLYIYPLKCKCSIFPQKSLFP